MEETNTGGSIVGVYCRPPDQKEEVDEAFYRHRSSLTITGPGSPEGLQPCWYLLEKQHCQADIVKSFLHCVADNLLSQVVEEPIRRGMLLDLVLTDKKDWLGM